MAASQGDLIQITDKQTYLSQQVLNVYYYRIIPLTGILDAGYDDLAAWFRDTVVAAVRKIQVAGLVHTELEVRNLTNAIDFRVLTHSLAGLVVVDVSTYSPSFLSVGFKLQRESLVTRNGSKRFAGLDEAHLAVNNYNFSPGSDRTDIEAALALTYEVGLVQIAEPIIPKRPITPPVAVGYQYASIGSAQYTGLGTQNTRKPGRGI